MTDLNSICPANGDVTPYQQHTTVSNVDMSAVHASSVLTIYLPIKRTESYFVQTLQTLPLYGLSGTVDSSSCTSNSAFTSS